MAEFVLLGVGNPLVGDDGLGIAAIDRLRQEWDLPEAVEIVDGGTWGMALLPVLEDAREVLIVDAITTGGEPGEVVSLERDQLPRHFRLRMSPHHVGLEDLFAVLELKGTGPERLSAVGIVPASLEWGMGLTPEAEGALPDLLDAIVARLAAAGFPPVPRPVAARPG